MLQYNIMKSLTLLIREVQASNLGQEAGYRDWNFLLVFLFLMEYAAIAS
jgi:hypothetical protein